MTRDPRKPFTLDEIMAKMPPAQLARIRARAAELEAEEMSLAQLRKARAMTQVALARKLGKTQALVSRIESAGDLYISTMRKQIEALGGGLDIRAVFPDMAPVSITGFSDLADVQFATPAAKTKKSKISAPGLKEAKARFRHRGQPARAKQGLRSAGK
jgi:transcriptional regulator with XRE-family HTH domain